MKNLVIRHTKGKRILLLFVLTNIVYAIMLTITVPGVTSYAGGMKLPDMMPFGYSATYVQTLFTALGPAGRHSYLYHQIPLDLVYPGLFAITYCLLYTFIVKKLGKQDGLLFYACYIPLFAGLFDYMENFGVIVMLKNYPGWPAALVKITCVFSVLKSMLTTIYFVLLIVVLVLLLRQYIIAGKNRTANR